VSQRVPGFSVFLSSAFSADIFFMLLFSMGFSELFVYSLVNGGDYRPGCMPGKPDGIKAGEALQKGLVLPCRCLLDSEVERPAAPAAQHVGNVGEFMGPWFHGRVRLGSGWLMPVILGMILSPSV